ncbi:2-hydroxyacyl-CoA lyase 2 isoform X1 [Sciurus carolinensis]|uniref:2-hydroxyacyl-CoA lyase 2 isoform X1 n=1 Tax=Sciurus carolinensis TaxID=30640 RepID=UPI001FB552E4|nr:2-hydroxyacyl-CoA lyase 2 isoform X1 [Sciurus carolinensis]XP_047387371.1 2-hydroxyacyl-CoA lyase 2 isoform X1 [Sciurus carolinensis]XP_047387372.1 2-hydroxyacyl-CoA lyase 2 isoform X1 [Sciurus carolinensis]XP_047387373.1 2-hydroxyacyl-CoA lyase 2 isoform X1 [Sciurus carolinensis]XP_047387374.1 2-hydroxyacyl-CoA lyase 2 isoform X1 [Sciurus carolinensis]
MENPAAIAPAKGFFPSFLLLACGTLLAALLGAAHRLGLFYQLMHKVDEASVRHGGEHVAAVLRAHGVRFLFTLVGGHISPLLVACEKLGIRVVDTRHEVTAVFAADAVARLTGTVGVAAVTAGPGLTNTVTAVKNAQVAQSAVLLLGGAASTLLQKRGALQAIDQMSLFRPLCKFCASVRRVRDITPTLRAAMAAAQSGTPGPVFVELPVDVLYPYFMIQKEMVPAKLPKGLMGRVISWYLKNCLANLFVGAWEPQPEGPLPLDIPQASPQQVQRCVEILSRAKRPLLVLGSQALLPPVPADRLRAAVETLGVPCFLGGMARGLLGRNHPLHIRQNRSAALKKADVVLLAGTVCDFRLSYGRILSRKSKIIIINRNRDDMLLNSDIFWKPQEAVQGDVASFMLKLVEGLQGQTWAPEWAEELREADRQKEQTYREKAVMPIAQHLNPVRVLQLVEETLPDNSFLVVDGGDFVATAAYLVQPRGPLRWLDPGAFGTLGVGAGFALGAKLCHPDAEVWCLFGDGAFGYSLIEFDTFVRHKIPVMALVGNDAGWTQISREQVPRLGSNVACGLAYTDYHKAAMGLGARGLLLSRENEDHVVKVLRDGQQQCRDGHPVVINILIGRTDFRDGSISV